MKRSLLAGVLGALLVLGVLGTTVAVLVSDEGKSRAPTSSAEPSAPSQDKHGEHGRSASKDKSHHGHGQPSWAGQKSKGSHQDRYAWRAAWRAMTSEQRAAKMKSLAKAHAEGMEEWRACADAAGDNKVERAACEKPLPPGHAKRR